MFNQVEWNKPNKWHLGFSANNASIYERIITVFFFTGFTAICAQITFLVSWTPVPYTFQTFAVLATGVFLRRNDAFVSGCLYLLVGGLGAPVFAEGKDILFSEGTLIASGGYLLAFPLASAIVAEGLDRSRKAGITEINAQLVCWLVAMLPVYFFGTLWLAKSYDVGLVQAYEWGVEPFLLWDAFKIVIMAIITTKIWSYSND
jgi:biotin transport system substrate-specific component